MEPECALMELFSQVLMPLALGTGPQGSTQDLLESGSTNRDQAWRQLERLRERRKAREQLEGKEEGTGLEEGIGLEEKGKEFTPVSSPLTEFHGPFPLKIKRAQIKGRYLRCFVSSLSSPLLSSEQVVPFLQKQTERPLTCSLKANNPFTYTTNNYLLNLTPFTKGVVQFTFATPLHSQPDKVFTLHEVALLLILP